MLKGAARWGVLLAAWSSPALAQVIDNFEGPLRWTATPSDGVNARIRTEGPQANGRSLRVDYDFAKGSGFVVVRRPVSLVLPAHYRFSVKVRGEGPPNNLEFKLIAARPDGHGGWEPGDDVWWCNRRAFEWPRDWRRTTYRERHISFAWGPGGGRQPLGRVAAIEFAIAAAEGGKGSVWLDDLRLEVLAAPSDAAPVLSGEGTAGSFGQEEAPPGARTLRWNHGANSWSFTATYGAPMEFGGFCLRGPAGRYEVESNTAPGVWEHAATIEVTPAGPAWARTPGLEGSALRVRGAGSPGEAALTVFGPEVGEDMNAMLRAMAAGSPRGTYPRYLSGEATSWTVVGLPDGDREALFSADGQVEVSRGGFTLEPFLEISPGEGPSRFISWADVEVANTLAADGSPSVGWAGPEGLRLTVSPEATGTPEAPGVSVAYRLEGAPAAGRARVVVAVRPLQALPPAQWLNLTGGFSPVKSVERTDAGLRVNHAWAVIAEGGSFAGSGPPGEFRSAVAGRVTGEASSAESVDGLAWGALASAWATPGSGPLTFRVSAGLRAVKPGEDARVLMARAAAEWSDAVSRVRLTVPPSAADLEETWRAQQRLILINADGPRLQPGSRTYERSWIRDGASIGTALCFTGHADRMREFVDWYGPFQFEDGKVPCVVDGRGPDPVPENDSHGEYLHAVATVYRFTGDRAFLERHWPRVVRTVAYLDGLIARRRTAEYAEGQATFPDGGGKVPRRAAYGLVPESISHEGYSAKPMHSLWDGFWTARGFKDAAFIAQTLGRPEAAGFLGRAAAYRAAMAASVALAGKATGAAWVPGCVELGDFDATSTAIAVWPTDEWRAPGGIPTPLFDATFEKYWSFFDARRAGTAEWKDYTPYEVRVIGAMLRLGALDARWTARAHELNRWFLADQRPRGWRQWGEVVFRDKNFPGFIGDYPHTWVGADYLNSVRAMFLDEQETAGGGNLALGLGIPAAWLDEAGPGGVGIDGAPTWWGRASFQVRRDGAKVLWTIRPEFRAGTGPATLTLWLPAPVGGAPAVTGPCALKEVAGRSIILTGPFRGEIGVTVEP
jgi:hypothetical protein